MGDMIHGLLAEIDRLRAESCADLIGQEHRLGGRIDCLEKERDTLSKEVERLKKIITQQVCNEDDLGYEYTYVTCLKEEVQKLKEENENLRRALGKL